MAEDIITHIFYNGCIYMQSFICKNIIIYHTANISIRTQYFMWQQGCGYCAAGRTAWMSQEPSG